MYSETYKDFMNEAKQRPSFVLLLLPYLILSLFLVSLFLLPSILRSFLSPIFLSFFLPSSLSFFMSLVPSFITFLCIYFVQVSSGERNERN